MIVKREESVNRLVPGQMPLVAVITAELLKSTLRGGYNRDIILS